MILSHSQNTKLCAIFRIPRNNLLIIFIAQRVLGKQHVGDRTHIHCNEIFECVLCGTLFKPFKTSNYFLSLNFKEQLLNLLQNPVIQHDLAEKFNFQRVNDGCMRDITDGFMYKKIMRSLNASQDD